MRSVLKFSFKKYKKEENLWEWLLLTIEKITMTELNILYGKECKKCVNKNESKTLLLKYSFSLRVQ